MVFPSNGDIENTKWERIARRCLPASDCADINQLGADFVEYLKRHRVGLDHPTVSSRFFYFCKYISTHGNN